MKKIYSTIVLVSAVSIFASAQMQQGPSMPGNKTVTTTRGINPGELSRKNNPSVQSTQSMWVNYGVAVDSLVYGGGVAVLNQNYLCTDSTLLGNFGSSGYAGVWVNNLGDILDVHSSVLQNYYGYAWNSSNNFTVDSMSVMYAYSRNTPANIVDTLIVSMYTNVPSSNMPTYYFTGMTANFGSDTLYFKAMPYTYTNNAPTASNRVTFKVPLTAADTAMTYFRMKDFTCNAFPVAGGKLVASSVTFKPGYAYAPGDTIDNKNAFFFASYEEGGAGTFPIYTYCPNTSSQACDWNVSQIVTSDIRYNNNTNWNGFFVPSYAYTAPYAFEHHLWYYKITSTNVGIPETAPAEISLEQNIPNPANGNTMFHYTIPTAGDVSFTISDVTGKLVMSSNTGHVAAGDYQMEFNTSNLQPGVYFYTIHLDGQQMTRKMIVSH